MNIAFNTRMASIQAIQYYILVRYFLQDGNKFLHRYSIFPTNNSKISNNQAKKNRAI